MLSHSANQEQVLIYFHIRVVNRILLENTHSLILPRSSRGQITYRTFFFFGSLLLSQT